MMEIKVKRKTYRVSYGHDPVYQYTDCFISDARRKTLVETTAMCSDDDQYSKAMGRKVALTKAINALFPEKKDRAAFWAAVWKARAEITTKKWTV